MKQRQNIRSDLIRWSAFCLLLGGVVIVPFLLVGEATELWSVARMNGSEVVVALTGLALLVIDVVLPVPSSFVLAALGTALGGFAGTAVGALGMTVACGFAYALGSVLGPRRIDRLVTPTEQARLARLLKRHGVLLLAACRTVPVLAEASILAAGILRLPIKRVFAATTLANIGVSGCYAVLGASVDDGVTFALAVALSMTIPAVAMVAAKNFGQRLGELAPDLRSKSTGELLQKEDARGH